MPVELHRLLVEPRSTDLFEALCDDYRRAASPQQRAQIRAFVKADRQLVSTLEHWHPPYEDETPERYLELKLMSISILGDVLSPINQGSFSGYARPNGPR